GPQRFEEEVPDWAAGRHALKGDLLERSNNNLVGGDPRTLVRQQVGPERVCNQHGGQHERRHEAIPWRDLCPRGDEKEQRKRVERDVILNYYVEESAPCEVDVSQYRNPSQPSDHRFHYPKRP